MTLNPGRVLVVAVLLFSSLGYGRSIPAAVDRIVVYKHRRRMVLISQGKRVRTYTVALGAEPIGAKHREGDHRTPEGTYVLDGLKDPSDYYKAFHISYPAAKDVDFARKHGFPPGSAIMLHGTPPEFLPSKDQSPPYDWTDGCIAVRNAEMDEILKLVAVGTPIEIRP